MFKLETTSPLPEGDDYARVYRTLKGLRLRDPDYVWLALDCTSVCWRGIPLVKRITDPTIAQKAIDDYFGAVTEEVTHVS